MPAEVVLTLSCGRLSGVDVFAIRLARGLIARGWPARLLLADPQAAVADRMLLPPDVPVDRLPVGPRAAAGRREQALIEYLTERGPTWWFPNYEFELLWALDRLPASVRPILVAHSDEPFYYRHVLRWAPWAAGIVAVSPWIARQLGRHDPRVAAATAVIPYGVPSAPVDLAIRRRREGPLRVVYLGRLDAEQKRVLDLPAIIAAARWQGADCRLTICGDGPARAELARRAARAGSDEALELLPPLRPDEVAHELARHDVLLLPSAWEGLPLVALEALAVGTVPVVSDLATIDPRIVEHDQTGYRVPPGDVAAFGAALAKLAGDHERLARLAAAGPPRLLRERLTLNDQVDRYLAFFAQQEAVPPPGVARKTGEDGSRSHASAIPAAGASRFPRRRWVERLPRAWRQMGNRIWTSWRGRATLSPRRAQRVLTRVAIFGSLPPHRGISGYCQEQAQAVARLVPVEYLNFGSMYPAWLYPGGGLATDDTFPPLDEARITVRRRLNWYNPISWWSEGLLTTGDLLHAQIWSLPLLPVAATVLAGYRLRGRPTVVTIHNADVSLHRAAYRLGLAVVLRLARAVIVHEPGALDTLASRHGVARERMRVIRSGTLDLHYDPTLDRSSARRHLGLTTAGPLLLFFGAIRRYKGLDVLLEALALARQTVPELELLVAGKLWEPWEPYQASIERLGLAGAVHCRLDYVPSAEVRYLFAAANAVVLPYRTFDAQSAVGTSALACGRPLVVTRLGGLPELVEDPACVVPPEDPRALGQVLARLASDPAWRDALAEGSRRRAALHSWETIGAETVALYRALVQGSAG